MGMRRRKGPTFINGVRVPALQATRFCAITHCQDCGGDRWAKEEFCLPKKYRRGKKRRIHWQA
jgi:hypothetical protein